LAGRVVVRPLIALILIRDRRSVAEPHEREPSVVFHVRLDRRAAAPPEPVLPAQRDDQQQRACCLHFTFAARSRIAFVLSARSVSSFSSCALYSFSSIDGRRSCRPAISFSSASF